MFDCVEIRAHRCCSLFYCKIQKKIGKIGNRSRDHSFGTYVKISEKLTFLSSGYVHPRVRFRGKMLVFRKILHT